jgi:hypothetical protein
MPRSIFTILDELAGGITELKAALAPLAALTRGGDGPFPSPVHPRKVGRPRKPAAAPAAAAQPASTPAKSAGSPRKRVSAKARAGRVLQGRYMGALRKLSKADQAEVKKARADQGVEAALKVAASKSG